MTAPAPGPLAAPGVAPPPAVRRKGSPAKAVLALALVGAAVGVPVGAYAMLNAAPAEAAVWGYAYMARPLVGATVEVHELAADGRPGELLGTTTTDTDGYYDLSVRRGSAQLLVTTSGGTYADSATGKKRSADAGGTLETVVVPGSERGPLTPLTTWATARAEWLAGAGTPIDAAVEVSFGATARQFNLESVTDKDPAIFDDPKDVQLAGLTSRQLGLLLAGLDMEARSLGVSPLALADAVAEDLSDGVLDGKDGSAALRIDGKVALPADATTARLQDAIDAVAGSAANKTHLPGPQIARQAPRLEPGTGSLYVTTTALPAWIDGRPGSATIQGKRGTTPYACQLSSGQLPKGFTLARGCVISGGGTPVLGKSTMLVSPPFTVRMSDASEPPMSATVELRITILARPPVIATTDGRCQQAGKACSLTVATATGGTAPYYFTTGSFASGTPPMGMTVNLKGVLTGTPSRAGSYTFRVCVVDLVGAMDCDSVTVSVGEASRAPSGELPSGFPADLPPGTYHIAACTSVSGFSTCVDGGDFVVTEGDARALAEGLSEAADQIRSACSCSVRYTAWNGKEFDLVITDASSGSVTTLRVTRLG